MELSGGDPTKGEEQLVSLPTFGERTRVREERLRGGVRARLVKVGVMRGKGGSRRISWRVSEEEQNKKGWG